MYDINKVNYILYVMMLRLISIGNVKTLVILVKLKVTFVDLAFICVLTIFFRNLWKATFCSLLKFCQIHQ